MLETAYDDSIVTRKIHMQVPGRLLRDLDLFDYRTRSDLLPRGHLGVSFTDVSMCVR